MTPDTSQTIAKSARRFFSGTMLSRMTGLVRDVAMGAAFGTQETVAAFLVAFRLSHLMRRLLGEGALQTAFIPQFEKIKQENPQRAGYFFRDLKLFLALLLSLLIVCAMGALSGALVLMDLSSGNRDIIFLTLLMLPSLLFICLYGLNAALLQCEKHYFTSSFAPVAFNLVWAVGVAVLWTLPAAEAMPWLSGFIIVACIAQWLFTVPTAYVLLRNLGLNQLWGQISLNEVRNLLKPLFLGILGVGASQISNAVDPLFARYADPEGPAYLWYAIRVQQLPLALFGVALSGALLPPLSRACANSDWPKFKEFLNLALRRGFALMLPITVAIFLFGDRSINLLYGRGEFHDLSVLKTTQCLWAYGIGLIPMTLVLFLAPAYYAQQNYRTPTIASLVTVLLNLGCNAVLVIGFGCGAAAVSLSTSLCAWVNFGLLAYGLRHHIASLAKSGGVILAISLAAVLTLVVLSTFDQSPPLKQILMGVAFPLPHSFADQAMQLLWPSALFGVLLAGCAWVTRAEDLLALLKR